MKESFEALAVAMTRGQTQLRITNNRTFPKFNGEVSNFASYWRRFRRTVDENEDFDTLEKVNRLYEGLSGDALRVTEGIDATVANYETLKSILVEEYGSYTKNKVDMVNSLRNLRKASNKASDCLHVLREIKIILRRLENAGSVITPEFCFLEVTNKFPYHIVKKILTDKTQNWKVDEILAKITEEVKAYSWKKKPKEISPVL
ncbi:unnamed protein product [Auanema sp. JU1783]|nr:unnamed protein product [Auanema sp. JU1783]